MGLEDWDFVLRPYGERWRKERRIFHSQMNMNSAPKFQSVQVHQARLFLKQLVDHLNELALSVRGYVYKVFKRRLPDPIFRVVGATIIDVVYGIQVTGITDPYIMRPEKSINMIAAAIMPGAFLVDLFPLRTCLHIFLHHKGK